MSTGLLQRPSTGAESLLSDATYGRPPLGQHESSPPITMEASGPFSIPFGNEGAFVFDQKPGPWFMPLLVRICELGLLPPNWDSYGAHPIDLRTATFSVEVLLEVLSESDPIPSVVPTSRGGIQLEWHEGGIDLEIDIQSPSSVDLSIEDGEHYEEFEHVRVETIQDKMNVLRRRLQRADDDA